MAFHLTDSYFVVAIEALRLHWTKPREKEKLLLEHVQDTAEVKTNHCHSWQRTNC